MDNQAYSFTSLQDNAHFDRSHRDSLPSDSFQPENSLHVSTQHEAALAIQHRLRNCKSSYAVRNIDLSQIQGLTNDRAPRAGDLVLARIDRLRQHARIELPSGRRAYLHVGDEVLLLYGNRYATDQFEARVPDDLGPCHMVAAGGIAARMISRCSAVKPATEITPIGLLCDDKGEVVNLRRHCLPLQPLSCREVPVLAVVGTGMNAGKTTMMANAIYAFKQQGISVAAGKLTGTAAGPDSWKYRDAGAVAVLDFTDFGMASSFGESLARLKAAAQSIVASLQQQQPDLIMLELADGLLQTETAQLMQDAELQRLVDGWLLAATDAIGVTAGAQLMRTIGCPVVAVGGLFTRSSLLEQEVKHSCGLPVLHSSNPVQNCEYMLASVKGLFAARKASALAVS